MKNEFLKIILVGFVLFCLIGATSASGNITGTEIIGNDANADFEENICLNDISSEDYLNAHCPEDMGESTFCGDGKNILSAESAHSFYFNSSKESSGDGSSWENANNSATAWTDIPYDGCNIYLAEGNYSQNSSFSYTNAIIIGQGMNTNISFYGDSSHYGDYDTLFEYTFINLTFNKYVNPDNSTRGANLYADYNFINCTFVDVPITRMGWGVSSISILASFENCEFINTNQSSLITLGYWGNLKFNKCIFNNISGDSIIFANGLNTNISIYDSCFEKCNIIGILNAPNVSTEYVISNCTYDFNVDNTAPIAKPNYVNTTDYTSIPTIYVNNTREVSGDGSSWENATKNINLFYGLCIRLAEGEYSIPNEHVDVTYVGLGEKTIIKQFSFNEIKIYANSNRLITVINATFDCGINVDGLDIKFINCTFVNSTFVSRTYQRSNPNRDTLTDVCTASFENCKFKDYNCTFLINNWEFSRFNFNNCVFENIIADAIVDSFGGNIDSYGRLDGIYIYNSSFSNCDINGISKARQYSYCVISNCNYDFPVSADIPLVGPFYINSTDRPVIQTYLDVVADENSLIITLTDEQNKPMVDYEIEIVTNGRVSYEYTDDKGKIILRNLFGNYSFEISYPGDEYAGYAPVSVNKSFIFAEIIDDGTNGSNSTPVTPTKVATKLTASKVTATYNIVKKLVITLKDKNGKALANKKVTVKVGSISKTLKTNKNGQVSLNVATLVPKTYTATVKFAGDSSYSASTVKPKVVVNKAKVKLAAKAKTFKLKAKVKKYTATLKDNKGKVMKNTKLTLKIGKKTYTAKTNKKGVATFKITKLSKKGTFKSKIAFRGDKWYKAISKTVKIKVK